jgi:hypothetical protein
VLAVGGSRVAVVVHLVTEIVRIRVDVGVVVVAVSGASPIAVVVAVVFTIGDDPVAVVVESVAALRGVSGVVGANRGACITSPSTFAATILIRAVARCSLPPGDADLFHTAEESLLTVLVILAGLTLTLISM